MIHFDMGVFDEALQKKHFNATNIVAKFELNSFKEKPCPSESEVPRIELLILLLSMLDFSIFFHIHHFFSTRIEQNWVIQSKDYINSVTE